MNCLRIEPACMFHVPGELFAAYQLAAQEMGPDRFVWMAACGDTGPAHICTRQACPSGACQVGASSVAPEVQDVLTSVIRDLPKVNR